MAQRLLNKVAVVTGASGRLGRAIVQKFVGEGAKLVVFARNRGRLDELESLAPARVVVVPGDVTRATDLELLRETTLRRLGRIDILVAAADQSRSATLEESTPEFVDKLFATNFQGALQTIRVLSRDFNSPASIVLVTRSLFDEPLAQWSAFAASKAALSSLARSLAVELAPRGIRVNSLALPSHTPVESATTRVPPPIVGDAAQTALFLASEESAGVTGQEIVVRGRD